MFDTQMIFFEVIFEKKNDFEKKIAENKKNAKLLRMQRIKTLSL